MKFTVSTKPLQDGLSLGVIKSNVSKFYQKSCLAQITADKHTLTINLEAASITSELLFKGVGEGEDKVTTFVDCLMLKDLVSTLDNNTTILEFVDGGVILISGKSKFTLPQMIDESDLELNKPSQITADAEIIDLDKASWKFIDDHQMFAIAMSFIHPVYTHIWVGDEGDVLVGDFDNSIFTHSSKSNLNTTCLLTDTIINLFNSLPDESKIIKLDNSYIINVKTDSFEYSAEFVPKLESDESVGDYNSKTILDMLTTSEDNCVSVNVEKMNKSLSQAVLISKDSENVITFKVDGSDVTLQDDNIECKIPIEQSTSESYQLKFKTILLKNTFSNMDEEKIQIMPMKQEDTIVGILIWTSNMSAVLAGVEE